MTRNSNRSIKINNPTHPQHQASLANGTKAIVKLSKASLVLNKVARDQLSAPEYVELAYDRDINTIRMISSTMEDGIPLIKTRVPASDFFAQYEIAAEGKYSAKYKQDEGALYISL